MIGFFAGAFWAGDCAHRTRTMRPKIGARFASSYALQLTLALAVFAPGMMYVHLVSRRMSELMPEAVADNAATPWVDPVRAREALQKVLEIPRWREMAAATTRRPLEELDSIPVEIVTSAHRILGAYRTRGEKLWCVPTLFAGGVLALLLLSVEAKRSGTGWTCIAFAAYIALLVYACEVFAFTKTASLTLAICNYVVLVVAWLLLRLQPRPPLWPSVCLVLATPWLWVPITNETGLLKSEPLVFTTVNTLGTIALTTLFQTGLARARVSPKNS
jgi:hypothetical protein